MKKVELKQIIREEIQNINEATYAPRKAELILKDFDKTIARNLVGNLEYADDYTDAEKIKEICAQFVSSIMKVMSKHKSTIAGV